MGKTAKRSVPDGHDPRPSARRSCHGREAPGGSCGRPPHAAAALERGLCRTIAANPFNESARSGTAPGVGVSGRSAADAELLDQRAVARLALALEVVEQRTTLRDHLEQATTGVVVLGVRLEVAGQVVDALGEDRDLDFRLAGVVRLGGMLFHERGLALGSDRHRLILRLGVDLAGASRDVVQQGPKPAIRLIAEGSRSRPRRPVGGGIHEMAANASAAAGRCPSREQRPGSRHQLPCRPDARRGLSSPRPPLRNWLRPCRSGAAAAGTCRSVVSDTCRFGCWRDVSKRRSRRDFRG